MARPPSTAGGRPHGVRVRFSDRELQALDTARGSLSRVDYLRSLIPGIKYPLTRETVRPNSPGPTGHLHHYKKGDHVGYNKGTKTYHYTCDCGAEKTE